MKLLLDHRERVAGQLQELRGHLAVIDKKLREGCGPDLERRIAARARTQAKRRKA
jgi:hypothetical protein